LRRVSRDRSRGDRRLRLQLDLAELGLTLGVVRSIVLADGDEPLDEMDNSENPNERAESGAGTKGRSLTPKGGHKIGQVGGVGKAR
jgi:hypothetical protein